MNILKETGIIRKVDELGRIVLPKEIRKTLGIKDGEDLEIYIKDKVIYLQKYSRLWALKDISEILIQYALEEMNLNIIITDKEQILASFNRELIYQKLDTKFENLLNSFEFYESITEEQFFSLNGFWFVKPINVHGDIIGFLILHSLNKIEEYMKNFLSFLEKIIINKIDIV